MILTRIPAGLLTGSYNKNNCTGKSSFTSNSEKANDGIIFQEEIPQKYQTMIDDIKRRYPDPEECNMKLIDLADKEFYRLSELEDKFSTKDDAGKDSASLYSGILQNLSKNVKDYNYHLRLIIGKNIYLSSNQRPAALIETLNCMDENNPDNSLCYKAAIDTRLVLFDKEFMSSVLMTCSKKVVPSIGGNNVLKQVVKGIYNIPYWDESTPDVIKMVKEKIYEGDAESAGEVKDELSKLEDYLAARTPQYTSRAYSKLMSSNSAIK